MAIVPQVEASRKVSTAKTECFVGFASIDSDMRDHRMSGLLRSELIKRIMAGSNEQALSILCAVAPIGFVPGIGEVSIPMNEFADFYGVTEEYLRGVLTRGRLLRKNYPDDVARYTCDEVLAAGAQITPCCNQYDAGEYIKYRLTAYGSRNWVSLPRQYKFSMLSPRLVLATALLMCYTEKNSEESTIKGVSLAIKRSPYRINKKEDAVEQPVEPQKEFEGIPFSEDGRLMISPELFAQMIRSAVKEAVSETLSTPGLYREVKQITK